MGNQVLLGTLRLLVLGDGDGAGIILGLYDGDEVPGAGGNSWGGSLFGQFCWDDRGRQIRDLRRFASRHGACFHSLGILLCSMV